jgi:hypothetical protein
MVCTSSLNGSSSRNQPHQPKGSIKTFSSASDGSKAAQDEEIIGADHFAEDTKFEGGLDMDINHNISAFFEKPEWPGGPGAPPPPDYEPVNAPALDNPDLPEWVRSFNLMAQLGENEEDDDDVHDAKRMWKNPEVIKRVKTVDAKGRAYGKCNEGNSF